MDSFVDENDIAFHYNPRFDHRCIVRNTRIQGKWGREEWPPHRMPFMKNVHFRLQVSIEQSCLKTVVNDSHFIDYNHRIRYETAGLFNIDGDVVVDRVTFQSPASCVSSHRDSIPSMIYSESEGTYLSCVDSEPFELLASPDDESAAVATEADVVQAKQK